MKKFVCIDIEMSEVTGKSKRLTHGMRNEVIQLGAVMLDENYNLLSEFSILVKPKYSSVSPVIEKLTGINDGMLENADDFITAFDKYASWLGTEEITTFCWSSSDYNQLWNEISLKAHHRTDLLEILKTFVDLQKSFGLLLNSPKAISLESAIKLSKQKFDGEQHTALCDAYNTAKVLHKICCSSLNVEFEKLYLSAEPEKDLNLNFSRKSTVKSSDCTESFASFMSEEFLAQYGIKKTEVEEEKAENVFEKNPCQKKNKQSKPNIFSFLKKKFLCSKYNIKISDWIKFYVRIMFATSMKAA